MDKKEISLSDKIREDNRWTIYPNISVEDIKESIKKILGDISQLKKIKIENIREIFKRRLGENLI